MTRKEAHEKVTKAMALLKEVGDEFVDDWGQIDSEEAQSLPCGGNPTNYLIAHALEPLKDAEPLLRAKSETEYYATIFSLTIKMAVESMLRDKED